VNRRLCLGWAIEQPSIRAGGRTPLEVIVGIGRTHTHRERERERERERREKEREREREREKRERERERSLTSRVYITNNSATDFWFEGRS
jgi:hypothetical protein